ncbi:FAD-binding oxidoreductase, partial [Rhizobium johnstonii]
GHFHIGVPDKDQQCDDEEGVIRTLKVAYAHGVPVTPRGAGTGNSGQAMPLSGGIVLNLAAMEKIKEVHPGRVVCEPG